MKKIRIVLVVLAVVVVLWAGMLITDTVRSQYFQEPVFAQFKEVWTGDKLLYEYQGIGYTVCQSEYCDENGNVYSESSEVRLFGILVSAVIT